MEYFLVGFVVGAGAAVIVTTIGLAVYYINSLRSSK